MNPFTLDPKGMPFPLDMRGELDDTAAFKSGKKWGDLEFPLPFGRTMTSAEEHVHDLDSNTGENCCSTAACARTALYANTSIEDKPKTGVISYSSGQLPGFVFFRSIFEAVHSEPQRQNLDHGCWWR